MIRPRINIVAGISTMCTSTALTTTAAISAIAAPKTMATAIATATAAAPAVTSTTIGTYEFHAQPIGKAVDQFHPVL